MIRNKSRFTGRGSVRRPLPGVKTDEITNEVTDQSSNTLSRYKEYPALKKGLAEWLEAVYREATDEEESIGIGNDRAPFKYINVWGYSSIDSAGDDGISSHTTASSVLNNAIRLLSFKDVVECLVKFKECSEAAAAIADSLLLTFIDKHKGRSEAEHTARKLQSKEVVRCVLSVKKYPEVAAILANELASNAGIASWQMGDIKNFPVDEVLKCISSFKVTERDRVLGMLLSPFENRPMTRIANALVKIAVGDSEAGVLAAKCISKCGGNLETAARMADYLSEFNGRVNSTSWETEELLDALRKVSEAKDSETALKVCVYYRTHP